MSGKNKFVCIHGHYYQPPRENAWLEHVEMQESAHPFHDWNARINFECYAPNAAARILDEKGWISKIRNNYNRISYNFGPTLLSWLEKYDAETYGLILKSDKKSMERFGGHGSALAQVHSHLILPLANYRDKITQVYWAVRDFERRFERYPEGIWLSETAVDTETLEVIASHGLQFTILAPQQAKAVRMAGESAWKPVNPETIDTSVPYWCVLPSGRKIALFFYNGEIARDVAFNGLLNSGKVFAKRLTSRFANDDTFQLSHIATDGESYGHHHRYGEMALADCLNYIEDNQLATLTNYGQFLELCPPQWEVQIHENSSWSCVHGVERWRSDCGCNTGGNPGWRQNWRGPLRQALNELRDKLSPVFELEGGRLLKDPWAARNEYIEVLNAGHKPEAIDQFIKKHARRQLSAEETVFVLRLMEMQRHAILMYTSCGWFFDEVSGIETAQILQYALRAIDYARDTAGLELLGSFMQKLTSVPSNVYPNAAIAFQKLVMPARVDLKRVAMHFAVSSVFSDHVEGTDAFNYTAGLNYFEKRKAGSQQLTLGDIEIKSKLTRSEKNFCFAVLYLGQHHLIGNISDKLPKSAFEELCKKAIAAFEAGNLGELISVLQLYFPSAEKFTLESLFRDEKVALLKNLTDVGLSQAEKAFRAVYNANFQLMVGLPDAQLPLPDAWRNLATFVLNADLRHFFEGSQRQDISELKRIASELKRWQIELTAEESLRHTIGERIYNEILQIAMETSSAARIQWLNEVLVVVFDMKLKPDIWRCQNVYYLLTKGYRKGQWMFLDEAWKSAFSRLAELLKVRMDIHGVTPVV